MSGRRSADRGRAPSVGLAAIAVAAFCGCTGGGEAPSADALPPAHPTETNLPMPGIGVEIEQGQVFRGRYDAAAKRVVVDRIIPGLSLYASEAVPGTTVPGFDVTADLGTHRRVLELVTGPWEATFDKQTEVLSWVSQFYKSIVAAARARGADTIDAVFVNGVETLDFTGFYCAQLSATVERFQTRTGVALRPAARIQWEDEEVFVCILRTAQDLRPQANYGVKLSAFADGGIARDFHGRPGAAVEMADGTTHTYGPGCMLTQEVYTALRASMAEGLSADALAFCEPTPQYTAGACSGGYEQPQFPCFPRCLMGQLCYGLSTNRIWYDGRAQTADAVLCDREQASEACVPAAIQSFTSNFPELYATTASEAVVERWTEEESAALRALLVINRCAAFINALSPEGVPAEPPVCAPTFWKKQLMGVLPKARIDQFKRHLPLGFAPYGGGTQDPPYTGLNAYIAQVCDSALFLGDAARQRCEQYVGHQGLYGYLGGKSISLFRIDGELALVVESRTQHLYVAGGYQGVRLGRGDIRLYPEMLRQSINFVRTLNGLAAE